MATETSTKTPAERLLDALGPVDRFEDYTGDLGSPARMTLEEYLEPHAVAGPATRLGPIEKVHLFWYAGMSCDGCTVAVTGAQAPTLEGLLMGAHPGLPRVILHHPVVNLEAGPRYVRSAELAVKGELDAPYVIVLEGSIADETIAQAYGGYWVGQGEQPWGPDGEQRTVTSEEWIARMAPGAAAMIAIGTCATWGGIPSAHGNPTGAMSLMDFLGKDYRSTFGVPVVNVPGCPPIGDNFTEAVAAIVYFLQGFGPLPEFDDLGRPAWQFGETVHRHCTRAAYYEEGDFATEFGDKECLVEIGCWGPVVNCNITSRGAINHVGGCMNSGGACIGCTMPGFPDKFTPFHKAPPGSLVSSTVSRMVGGFIRPLRMYSNEHLNREVRWDLENHVPSGWARELTEPGTVRQLGHKFYDRLRRTGDRGKASGETWGKRDEWTQTEDPGLERRLPGGEDETLTIDEGR
ncbi:MAG: [Ni/Fe] hydrogenase, small subunit MSMEG_2720 [uncultured Solirubrobacteraceae bacterium]|uniref:[Ni/Fe] hydrogenase, small subunit MSMEG_2720 n=1 Tax=uncultured Solirubrobacteraceae bacterium TaxID=1162706 RepID=A0A6J4RT21_9ACTN|nr:MAG: [Ni/Fe] hydrogenase, small subunit MSMEG_2720 [uncultured Solirubrobacteraceae bacterium]